MPELLNDVPQANQTLGITQPLIRTNFSNIDAAFQVDHIGYTLSGQGKHVQVTFPVQTTTTITGPDIGLVSLLNANTTQNELNFKSQAGVLTPFTASSKADPGWSYLPSGLLIKWGRTSVGSAGSNINITAAQGPTYNAAAGSVYSVLLSFAGGITGNFVSVNTYGLIGQGNTFTVNANGVVGFTYLMIGNT